MRIGLGLVVFAAACGGDSGVSVHAHGNAQKGPFITGSSVQFYPVDDNLTQVSKVFQAFVSDDLGAFDTSFSQSEPNIEVAVTGFYADELSGELSNAQITLRAVRGAQADVAV